MIKINFFLKASKNGQKDILDISINSGGNLHDKDNHGSPVLNFGKNIGINFFYSTVSS